MKLVGLAPLLLAATANATSPVPPPTATAENFAVAEKLKVAIGDGDLREAQALFTDNLEVFYDGLEVRSSKAAAIYAMDHGGEGVWKKFTCKPARVDRTSVSRNKIVMLLSYPGGSFCNYPDRSNQIQIFSVVGDSMISKIYFWPLNG